MNLKKIKVYHLFWIVAAIILLIGIVIPDETLDINIHSTYFVISYRDASFVLFVFYFLSGFGYWLIQKVLKKKLEKWLTITHAFIVIGSFVFYWLVVLYSKLFFSNDFPLFDNASYLINITVVLEFLLISFVGLPIYIANILVGIFRTNK